MSPLLVNPTEQSPGVFVRSVPPDHEPRPAIWTVDLTPIRRSEVHDDDTELVAPIEESGDTIALEPEMAILVGTKMIHSALVAQKLSGDIPYASGPAALRAFKSAWYAVAGKRLRV